MPDLRRTVKTTRLMAQASPQKLPRGEADTYSTVALSETASVTPLLSDLSIAACNQSNEESDVQPVVQAPEANDDSGDAVVMVPTRMSCVCCSVVFAHRTEQKAHFKSDWHRYNLKQQLRGEVCITEDTFEAMTGDVSSISGSDDTSTSSTEEEGGVKPTVLPRIKRLQVCDSANTSDSEGEDNSAIMAATRKHPKVFLRNGSGQLVSLYRCVLYHKKWSPNTPAELLSLAEQAKTYTRVAMVMLAGGHFSAAIFDGTEAVVHKTFHRYVVRAKRGTVQSVRDNQGSAPKSGGATLRRYNEAALTQEIQELLAGWSPQLQACHLIFLRTSAYSRNIFFGGKTPILGKGDPRVRTIPFTTGRPTFNEAKRVHHMLMAVECFGDESQVTGFVPVSPPRGLHPDTGQLVVRPDTARSPGRQGKAKSRKAKGDIEQDAEKQEEAVAQSGEDGDASESDREIELVEVVEERRTDDLQEFAWSVGPARRNRKKKKKGGQKVTTSEKESAPQAAPVDLAVETLQLSEEDTDLKNKLYTCCKSGDVTQLSQLLKELRDYAGHDSSSVDLPQRGVTTTDSQHFNHLPQLESRLPSPPQSSVVPPSSTHPHTARSKESVRTSGTGRVSEATYNSVGEQESEAADTRSEQRTDAAENCDHGNNKPTESQTSHASVLSTEHSVCPQSAVSLEASSLPTHSDNGGASQNSGGDSVLPCGIDPLALEGRARFEAVVLGRYGDRGSSLLHVAASSGHDDVLTALLDAGCDPCVRDSNGKTPYAVAGTKDVRNVFRRFRGNHPDRYDYDVAQIPSALTSDMELDRKQREAEKRKQQKKAKQERLKDRKAEEAKAAQEQKQKERFLNLSDREKRALAAERRLLTQATVQGASVVLNRCFQCGMDISGKVPFEYMEFKFCSPKCLKEHRMKGSK